MKRFIAIAATAICCMGNEIPAQALDMIIEIAKLQIPKIERHQDAFMKLVDKGLLDAACSENESCQVAGWNSTIQHS